MGRVMQIREVLNRDFLRRYSFATGVVALIAAMTGVIFFKDLVGLATGGDGPSAGAGAQGGANRGGSNQAEASGHPQAGAGGQKQGGAPQGAPGGGSGAPVVEVAAVAPAQFFSAARPGPATARGREQRRH